MIDPSAGIPNIRPAAQPTIKTGGPGPTGELTGAFGDYLKSAMENLNAERAHSMALTEQFVSGGPVDVSQVAIAMNQVGLSMQLLVEVRNKVLDAYETLLRMPV